MVFVKQGFISFDITNRSNLEQLVLYTIEYLLTNFVYFASYKIKISRSHKK